MLNEPHIFYPSRKLLVILAGKWWLLSILVSFLIWSVLGGLLIDILIALILGASTFTAIGVIIIGPLSKVTLTSEWLKGYNAFSLYRFLNWNTITKANKVVFCGLHYYKIFDKEHFLPIWLPLFHDNQAELERLICEYTAPDNPLHRLIKKEQHRKQKKAQAQQAKLASSKKPQA